MSGNEPEHHVQPLMGAAVGESPGHQPEHDRRRAYTHSADSSAELFSDRLLSTLRLAQRQDTGGRRGLPLPHLERPTVSSSSLYVVTAMDVWGRLADRSPFRALQWGHDIPLALSVVHGAMVILPKPAGKHLVTRQGHLRLPASVRHRCHLKAGDRVLLVGFAERNLLVAYPTSVLDAMVLAYHATLVEEASR